jgi:hypothetical protein
VGIETYPPLSTLHQLHFIYGNHEDYSLVGKMRAGRRLESKYHIRSSPVTCSAWVVSPLPGFETFS